MSPKRVAIACQGGGSQCAFVAGVLKTLFEERIQDRYRIVALSGTSGGALTAAVTWAGMVRQAHGDDRPVEDRIVAFWKDLSAQSPGEMFLDATATQLSRLVEAGLLPSLATSPSSPRFRLMAQAGAMMSSRPEFTDLRLLLAKHFDFEAIRLLVEEDSPVLLVGAADLMEGNFKVFSSAKGEVNLDSLLASACIPNLFPAAWVEGHAYWDGIFSSNPPVVAFLKKKLMGHEPPPEEIWIIQVNRAQHDSIPEKPGDIFDRRNQLAGNLSLGHELEFIAMVNFLIQEGALVDSFKARFGLETTRQIAVRFVRMSPGLQASLDYPSKLSRQPSHIARLLADGEAQGRAFVAELQKGEEPAVPGVGGHLIDPLQVAVR